MIRGRNELLLPSAGQAPDRPGFVAVLPGNPMAAAHEWCMDTGEGGEMESIAISSENAAVAVGPHSQGLRRGNILAVGGQVGADPKSGILCQGVHEQLRQAMTNLQAVLEEAGSSFADVVLLHVYLTEQGHFREMDTVLGEFLSEPFPARTTVYVELPPGMLIEIDALAVVE